MQKFTDLQELIKSRRSTKPGMMNGEKIDNQIILQLLELGNWAPTHANTEPWRFIVYEKEGLQRFCFEHAELYKSTSSSEQFTEAKYNNLLQLYRTVSHTIIVYMKRSEPAKIPVVEELAAVAAAIQNILLGAQAAGISVLWSTSGMTHQPAFKQFLGLSNEDTVMALLHMGYSEQPAKEGTRKIPMEEKINWHSV
jgi:nitroreductase